jgi:superfamily I DNA and RNA helicase
MPIDSSDRFIATEPAGARGEAGEKKVWDVVRAAFMPRPESFGFWHYPVFSKAGQKFKEPDFLVVDREFGLTIIEVKSVDIGYIESIQGHLWKYRDPKRPQGNPFEQARHQLQALLDHCDSQGRLVHNVPGRVLVGLPLITERAWQERGFHLLPSCPPIIFKDDLASEERFISRLRNAHIVAYAPPLDDEQWALLGHVIAGTPVLKKEPREPDARPDARRTAIAEVQGDFHKLDLQQLRIGTEIPPGAQRVRGIAGSGKTVLLCQKAAHMHLKHPDWDIAVVFFTRSLYDQIIRTLDRWLRHFSGDEVRFDPATSKLKVLHAWGGKNQAGFYETLCRRHGQKPKVVDRKGDALKPNERLAAVCAELMDAAEIKPCFDAVLIDEAQDMVVYEGFKRDGRQPIFWLAYRALRECDPDRPEQRRLIWAYDEAQSLDALSIPTAREIFGEELGGLVSGLHVGGIRKSEVMQKCYRTPGPILTAAHAIGMGLLRPEGMLSGITTREGWEAIGYEVTGSFSPPGQEVTLRRPPENSPNRVPQVWGGSVIEFRTYKTRREELDALAEAVHHNLEYDGLSPSRDILVVVLGADYEAAKLRAEVARHLMGRGVRIFTPGALECDVIEPKYPAFNANNFWRDGGVTVSQIHRAKGNEAEMVHVIGFDLVARDEGSVNLRNGLFVALTRSRGWARLSGVGEHPICEEMRRALAASDTFTFTFTRPPQRDFGEEG